MPNQPDNEDLEVHLNAWQPLADRLGRQLTPDDAREIRRNLAVLLLELRATQLELDATARGQKELLDEQAPSP